MLYIIDDRTKRQEQYLSNFNGEVPAQIRPFTGVEIKEFRSECKNSQSLHMLKGAKLIAAHASTLFEIQKYRVFLEDYCKKKSIPLIFFSGAYSINTTIIPDFLYSANVASFYKKLYTIKNPSHFFNPNILLFGEKFLLSKLMNFRRRLIVLEQNQQIDLILDEESDYEGIPVLERIISKLKMEPRPSSLVSSNYIQEEINKILFDVSSNL